MFYKLANNGWFTFAAIFCLAVSHVLGFLGWFSLLFALIIGAYALCVLIGDTIPMLLDPTEHWDTAPIRTIGNPFFVLYFFLVAIVNLIGFIRWILT